MSAPNLQRDFLRLLVLPALTLLLLPLLTVGFSLYGESKLDGIILANIESSIASDGSLDAEQKAAATEYYRAHPPSSVCSDPSPELARYREAVCRTGDEVWQFLWGEKLGWAMIALGLAAFLLIGVLSLVAHRAPSLQYAAFMTGWRSLVAIITTQTVVQGVLAVWLSYWVTALLIEKYVPKLIFLVAIIAIGAVLLIVSGLFKKPPQPQPLEAEQVTETDAPALWHRLRQLALKLGTPAPRAIAAGIDDNFFVTENGLELSGGQKLEGRTLYMSLPLLRIMETSEADAVFGHELAHFQGGDTAASARLYPALVRYDQYCGLLFDGGVTRPAGYVMALFRSLFDLGLKKEQRRREHVADEQAVRLTSPDELGRSLLKVAGYSSFRQLTEEELFGHREQHREELALQQRIDAGLAQHAASAAFLDALKQTRIPHPFDSHPPLAERLSHVKATVRVEDSTRLFAEPPKQTWADEVLTSRGIEERLWTAYEARFKANHEQSLAWRYLPATDEERRHVQSYFPDVTFQLKDGGVLRVTYLGISLPEGEQVAFRSITNAVVDNGHFSTQLVISHANGTTKVNLGHLKDQAEPFKATFGHYWQRDQVARQSANAQAA